MLAKRRERLGKQEVGARVVRLDHQALLAVVSRGLVLPAFEQQLGAFQPRLVAVAVRDAVADGLGHEADGVADQPGLRGQMDVDAPEDVFRRDGLQLLPVLLIDVLCCLHLAHLQDALRLVEALRTPSHQSVRAASPSTAADRMLRRGRPTLHACHGRHNY